MCKSGVGVCLRLVEDTAISPQEGKQNMRVGRPGTVLSLSQVHPSKLRSSDLGSTGSQSQQTHPRPSGISSHVCIHCLLMFSGNWILDSWWEGTGITG